MVNLFISLPENLLHRLLADACASNSSVDDQIRKALLSGYAEPPKTPQSLSNHAAVKIAVERATAKTTGEEFSLEDLFSEDEWAFFGTRTTVLGRMFRQAIESTAPQVAYHDRKTGANKAVYIRR
jgi:hypothetical protein